MHVGSRRRNCAQAVLCPWTRFVPLIASRPHLGEIVSQRARNGGRRMTWLSRRGARWGGNLAYIDRSRAQQRFFIFTQKARCAADRREDDAERDFALNTDFRVTRHLVIDLDGGQAVRPFVSVIACASSQKTALFHASKDRSRVGLRCELRDPLPNVWQLRSLMRLPVGPSTGVR